MQSFRKIQKNENRALIIIRYNGLKFMALVFLSKNHSNFFHYLFWTEKSSKFIDA